MLRARIVRSQGVNGLTIQSRILFVSVKNPAICREASTRHSLDIASNRFGKGGELSLHAPGD